MRVMLACHNLPPEFTGGTERVVSVLAKELDALGHEVEVFCGSERRADECTTLTEQLDDVRVTRVLRSAVQTNPVDGHEPEVAAIWDQALSRFSPDVVHVHHWANLTDDLIAIAARRGIPSVCTLHDFYSDCGLFFRLPDGEHFCSEHRSESQCVPCLQNVHQMDGDELRFAFAMRDQSFSQELDLSAAILFPGAIHRDSYINCGDHSETVRGKMSVIPLGAEDLPALTVPSPSVDGAVIMAHWGNLSGVKGLDVLARAAAQSKASDRLVLRLFGTVVEEGLIERLEQELGTVQLEVGGSYEVEDLPGLLEGVSFAVFPSLARETHSLVLDEATRLGFPLIVSDRGALPARAGDRGIVTEAGSVEALSAAIDAMADPSTHARYCAGSPSGELLSTTQHAVDVLEVLQRSIDQPPVFPSVIPDFGRARLAFRNRRLDTIIHHVRGVNDHCARVVRAVSGDSDELARLRETHPEIAAAIEAAISIDQDSRS